MIPYQLLTDTMFEVIRKAVLFMPSDVMDHLERVKNEEQDALAVEHVKLTIKNAEMAKMGKGLICADTGFPLFFISIGDDVEIEGGFASLTESARAAVAKATSENFLRPTMVDPITRKNPGNNLGKVIPAIDIVYSGRSDGLKIIAVPKGGGSEIFGTFYRMLFPSDGIEGVLKFVYDSVMDGCYSGKICPPAIVGVGIGGTADICMHLAKKAAVLRGVGSRHDVQTIAQLEIKLEEAFKMSGIGPMGSRGVNAVMAVHIETEVTHTAALPVAVNAQCCIGRRWKANISAKNDVVYSGDFL